MEPGKRPGRAAPVRGHSVRNRESARRHDVRPYGPQAASRRNPQVPDSLREFADEEGLPQADLRMLASIQFRGEQPQTKERWRYIYTAIATSRAIDTTETSPRRENRRKAT